MNSVGRCRVRDLVASCFNTCRLPLDEEPGISGSEPPPKTSNQSVSSKKEDAAAAPSVQTSSHNTGGGGGGGGGGRAAEVEPRFADEDYIVFCFGEDGEIHMMNDTKSSEKICSKKGQKRTTSEEVAAAASTSQPCSSSSRKGEVEQSKMDSFESCDSNLSDNSTSSFAFPVVGMEWIGSPAHMPNTEKCDGAAACRRCCMKLA